MSFLDFSDEDLAGAVEPKAVDDGEYTLKIVDWKTDDEGNVQKKDVNEAPYMMPVLEIVECPEADYAKPITHFLRLPHGEMTKKERNEALWHLRMFCEAFSIDASERNNFEDTLGKTAEALLIISPDTGYGEQNRVQRFLAPK